LQNVASYTYHLEKSLYEELETIKHKPYSRTSKTEFVSRITKELVRVLNDTEIGYQHLFYYGVAIIVDVLLAHPRHIPSMATEVNEPQILYYFNEILKRIGEDALYQEGLQSRKLHRRNLSDGARRMLEAMNAYPCEELKCVHERYNHTCKRLLRLARREVSSRVYVCIGQRLPTELCDMIVEATHIAERIDLPCSEFSAEFPCSSSIGTHAFDWDDWLGRHRRHSDYDNESVSSGPEWGYSERSFGSEDLKSELSSEELEIDSTHHESEDDEHNDENTEENVAS
jgi:hypothetical protein